MSQKYTKNTMRANLKKYYIYGVLVLIVAILSVISLGKVQFFGPGHFLNWESIVILLRSAIPILTLCGGFTLLMISGNIDLSVGSGLSLGAVVYAFLALNGFGFVLSFIITLVLGIGMGVLNGLLVMKLRITPVIATLVTMNLFKGAALLIVPDGVQSISGLPSWFNDYGRKGILGTGLPMAFIVAIVVIVLLVIVQRKTILGKYSAAIGGNRIAAELSGISAVKTVWLLYIIVGFLAALAGIARASYMSTGNPLSGDGLETDCIIAVLLGGTSFAGGEGSVAKSAIGALIIMCVTIGLMTAIPTYWQTIAKGCVLVIAVVLNHVLVREKVKA